LNPPDAFQVPHTQPLPPDVAAALARASARLGPFAGAVQWFAELSSTNDLAGELAAHGAREGTVVIAEAQTAGRGRLGRTWQSPAGAGLYFSLVVRPVTSMLPLLTLAAGVAIASAIEAAANLVPVLKWPNDVYIGRRKLAGILAEGGGAASGIGHVVVGIGINLRPASYPPEIAERATSLVGELGRDVERGVVLAEGLAAFAARYDDLRHGRGEAVLRAWRAYAAPLLGRVVEWDAQDGARQGIAEGIDQTGALVVRTGDGTVRVVSGEVRWM
jgi:BirA family transcriptional regulator, biotin operon repressor / biotin---[acetyl-CoA-carboxylase] ligase